jgi:hypothetical protein
LLDLKSETFPLGSCRTVELPIFHSKAFTKILPGTKADYYVYISQRGLNTVVIAKCKILPGNSFDCQENPFAYGEGIIIKYFYLDSGDFVGFFASYDT